MVTFAPQSPSYLSSLSIPGSIRGPRLRQSTHQEEDHLADVVQGLRHSLLELLEFQRTERKDMEMVIHMAIHMDIY